MNIGMPGELVVVLILVFVVLVLPYWQIFKKAGFSPWLSLLMFVPLANLGMMYFLAFAKWPSQNKSQ